MFRSDMHAFGANRSSASGNGLPTVRWSTRYPGRRAKARCRYIPAHVTDIGRAPPLFQLQGHDLTFKTRVVSGFKELAANLLRKFMLFLGVADTPTRTRLACITCANTSLGNRE